MTAENRLLSSSLGSVIAPAGCGKTELVCQAVGLNKERAILILTHTHAGVRAIRDRLKRMGIEKNRAHVETIAGWCLRYCCSYPKNSNVQIKQPQAGDWESIYDGMLSLFRSDILRGVVQSTYSRILVDEYQDCTVKQHEVISTIAKEVPTCVVGDPLQGIFRFAGGNLSWSKDVQTTFPSLGELSEPWRWRGRNEDLGKWLISIRSPLIKGEAIDLSNAPLDWREKSSENQIKAAFRLKSLVGGTVAIRKWPHDAHSFARNLGGSFFSMETVDCEDLLSFAQEMDEAKNLGRSICLINFAGDCYTKVKTALDGPLGQFEKGKIPKLSLYKNEKIVQAVKSLSEIISDSSYSNILAAMSSIERIEGAKVFRRELWQEAKSSLIECERGHFPSLREAAWALRNRVRAMGKKIDSHCISRTLLIKGLEFDHALVLDGDEFEDKKIPGDGARHFYVAATRASSSLCILSSKKQIRFDPAGI